MQNLIRSLSKLFGSDKFFMYTAALLVVQAVWFVLTAQYPLAFDENYHFGIIKLYAEQWGPFFHQTPPDSGAFGALVREPSYLFHYLMSFPLRFIALFTENEVAQIIFLRFINVALFVGGLFAFRRLLDQFGIDRRLTHFSLLMLVFVPVVPFLAAHINYDNLLFLTLPVILSLAYSSVTTLRKTGSIPMATFLSFIILSLFTALVKYVFLPILAGICLYLLVVFIRQDGKKEIITRSFNNFLDLKPLIKIGLVAGLLISGGLFIERDVVNTLRYGSPYPDCSQVESVEHCLGYGPWRRDYRLAQEVEEGVRAKADPNPVHYGLNWANDLVYRLYFAINHDYSNKPPLPIPYGVALGIGALGILLVCRYAKRISTRYPGLSMSLLATLLYLLALFYTNYTAYLETSVRVAVNGRYLIPLFPIIFVAVGLAFSYLMNSLRKTWRPYVQGALLTMALLFVIQGGGMVTFLVHSEPDWYWQNQTVISFNQALQRIVTPLIIGAD